MTRSRQNRPILGHPYSCKKIATITSSTATTTTNKIVSNKRFYQNQLSQNQRQKNINNHPRSESSCCCEYSRKSTTEYLSSYHACRIHNQRTIIGQQRKRFSHSDNKDNDNEKDNIGQLTKLFPISLIRLPLTDRWVNCSFKKNQKNRELKKFHFSSLLFTSYFTAFISNAFF